MLYQDSQARLSTSPHISKLSVESWLLLPTPYSLHPASLLLSLGVTSSSFRLRLALLGNLWLGRCSDHCLNSRSLFLDDRDVSHGRALFTEELDAARVRKVRDID